MVLMKYVRTGITRGAEQIHLGNPLALYTAVRYRWPWFQIVVGNFENSMHLYQLLVRIVKIALRIREIFTSLIFIYDSDRVDHSYSLSTPPHPHPHSNPTIYKIIYNRATRYACITCIIDEMNK